jgi:sigma-B regulation protein RsbU (phosphoserine phosphatase)
MKPNAEVRVLVVEDDPFFQRVLQKRLSIDGYQVMAASDGREGMKAIVTFEPDLVISDWMMPEVDGLELCQSVKTGLREAAPYFILLTAKGEINDRLLGLETGADDYLVKPCDQGELMARVRAGLRIVGLTQQLRRAVDELKAANLKLSGGHAEIVRVPDLLPMCTNCHNVRVGPDEWQPLERYLAAHGDKAPRPSLCPDCSSSEDKPRRAAGA